MESNFTLDEQFITDVQFSSNDGMRSEEAEKYFNELTRKSGHLVLEAKKYQKSFDATVTLDEFLNQIKTRTGPQYVIDGLRPHNYLAGFVDFFSILETDQEYNLSYLILATAKAVFESPKLYYSEYNQRWQLRKSGLIEAASWIFDVKNKKVIKDEPLIITKIVLPTPFGVEF